METQKLEDFKKENYKINSKWNFDAFSIKCKKCGSEEVEFKGHIELDSTGCYYPEDSPSLEGEIVIKCHGCGNAFTINKYKLEED